MFDQKWKRLEISCPSVVDIEDTIANEGGDTNVEKSSAWGWAVIKRTMLTNGATEMLGLAPQGDLERRIQEHIDALKGQNGE